MGRFKTSFDDIYMLECITLARNGAGWVSPNPMVGAVIVKNGKLLGKGYHREFGSAHAEVDAIRSAKHGLHGSTLYVNLEPCSHFGKTPPCTDLIVSSGIKEVVIGMRDPNRLVNGRGVRELRGAGIKVREGICLDECRRLNEAFTKFITTGRPFVALKIAQTLDGKIADMQKRSRWITGAASRGLVHRLRSQYDAVLVGAVTVRHDNPLLTVRGHRGRNPLRIIIDGRFTAPLTSRVFKRSSSSRTLVIAAHSFLRRQEVKRLALERNGVEVIGLPSKHNGRLSLRSVVNELGSRGIASVLVEGGASMFSGFVSEQLADKVIVFTAPKLLGAGLNAFAHLPGRRMGKEIKLNNVTTYLLENDILVEAYLH
jgi:diaminohydroxyphosphoribosylaminopyrimidine deaminase/5-amino-6-(5-phosphoribosylamino)uracil reductase